MQDVHSYEQTQEPPGATVYIETYQLAYLH
jgi:hypothetical protein